MRQTPVTETRGHGLYLWSPCRAYPPQRAANHTTRPCTDSAQLASTSAHGGRLAAAPWRKLLPRVAQARHCAVVRAPRGRRPGPFLRQLQVLHRHGPRRAFLHSLDDDATGGRLRLRLATRRRRRRQPLLPDARQREPDHPRRPPPPLRARPPCRRPRARRPRRGAAQRATVVDLVATVPPCPEHAGLPELVLQHEERRWRQQEERQAAAAALSRGETQQGVVVVEDTAALPLVPRAAVPEGEGPAAVLGAAPPGRAGEPGARVHVEPGVVPWQCRHGRPRRHPLLQEVQRSSMMCNTAGRRMDCTEERFDVNSRVVSSQLNFFVCVLG